MIELNAVNFVQATKGKSYIKSFKQIRLSEEFRSISARARDLYELCMDKLSLSIKNKWVDEEGKSFIKYSLREIKIDLNCSEETARKYKDMLVKAGYLKQKRHRNASNSYYICLPSSLKQIDKKALIEADQEKARIKNEARIERKKLRELEGNTEEQGMIKQQIEVKHVDRSELEEAERNRIIEIQKQTAKAEDASKLIDLLKKYNVEINELQASLLTELDYSKEMIYEALHVCVAKIKSVKQKISYKYFAGVMKNLKNAESKKATNSTKKASKKQSNTNTSVNDNKAVTTENTNEVTAIETNPFGNENIFGTQDDNKPIGEQNKYIKKTKFHNFEETFTKYTPEELDKIIEQSQRDKFK